MVPHKLDAAVAPAFLGTPDDGTAGTDDSGNPILAPGNLFILGPRDDKDDPNAKAIWAVRAHVRQWTTDTHGLEPEWVSRGMRTAYTGDTPATTVSSDRLLPGTFVARCRIMTARVTVNGQEFDYRVPDGRVVEATLLLQSEDADWGRLLDPLDPRIFLKQAVCVGGQIPFGEFVPISNGPRWASQFESFLTGVKSEGLSSSGLMVDARTIFPWRGDHDHPTIAVPVPYLIEVRLPPDRTRSETPALVVLPDLEQLATPRYAAAAAALRAEFAALAAALSPPPTAGLTGRLRWVSLDLTDSGTIPDFFWDVGRLGGMVNTSFRFGSGAWSLRVSDQPLGAPGARPQGVLSALPDVSIPYPVEGGDQDALEITITPPRRVDERPAVTPAKFTYTAVRTEDNTDFSEAVQIKNVRTAYDGPGVARLLRQVAGVPDPELNPPAAEADALDLLAATTPAAPLRDARIDPPVLYGFLPLDDGWAQLPFLNVTEQVLLDVLPPPNRAAARAAADRVPLLGGAVVFGTDGDGLLDEAGGELAWSITLLDASWYSGTWRLDKFALQEVHIDFADPVLTVEGLLHLATTPPSAADALPTFDNWLAPLTPVVLRTDAEADLYPSPFLVELQILAFARRSEPAAPVTAALGGWTFAYAANDRPLNRADPTGPSIYEHLLYRTLYDGPAVWPGPPALPPGLVWRRHAHAPMIQSLPLTQTATPPNTPSASRQLFPFALAAKAKVIEVEGEAVTMRSPDRWQFEVMAKDGETSPPGAVRWPTLATPATVRPAVGGGLMLVALGVPGLVFDPDAVHGLFADVAEEADKLLPAQYRHDLPVLDEVNALATLPKDDEAAPPAEAPPALLPPAYRAFWDRLAGLAFFAAADASAALVAGPPVVARGVVEPFDWPVTARFATRPYPGSLTFTDDNGRSVFLSGGGPARDALRGLEGGFRVRGDGRLELTDPATAAFVVTGESMAAARRPDGLVRDQRGLARGATEERTAANDRMVLRTLVALADDVAGNEVVSLWTTGRPIDLTPTAGDAWQFWFRDVPTVAAADGWTFRPAVGSSAQRRGVNDPAALTRERVARSGYEWRLGDRPDDPHAADAKKPWLGLGPLRFFPLSLEGLTFDVAGEPTEVVLVGRLHLPLSTDPEEPEPDTRANAVRLTLGATGAVIASVLELPDFDDPPAGGPDPVVVNEWPLAAAPDAPVMRWTRVEIDDAVVAITFRLVYVSHGVLWTLPEKVARIPLDGQPATVSYADTDFRAEADAAVAVVAGELVLDPAKGRHGFTAIWKFAWGNPGELRLVAEYRDTVLAPPVLPTDAPLTARFEFQEQALPLQLDRTGGADLLVPNLDSRAVQIQWSGVQTDPDEVRGFQVLPGFHLGADPSDEGTAVQASRGYGVLAFDLKEQVLDVPTVNLPQAGTFEAIFACRWGASLHAPLAAGRTEAERVFGSSHGAIDAAYTSRFNRRSSVAPPPWESELLLNGVLEVKNLASWPALQEDGGAVNVVTLPASRGAEGKPLSHVRHTIRVLFNQHTVPADVLRPGRSAKTFLEIKPGRAWEPRAAVEHQFAWVDLSTADEIEVGRETRLVLVQEVRFAAPDAFGATLGALNGVDTIAASRREDQYAGNDWNSMLVRTDELPRVARGYLSRTMIGRLTGSDGAIQSLLEQDPDGGPPVYDAMLIEASVAAYLAKAAAAAGPPSNLSYLPGGTTQAVLTALSDFQAGPGGEDWWHLAVVPFLGRTQPQRHDQVVEQPAAPVVLKGDLRVDPVLQIARAAGGAPPLNRLALALANREDRTPVAVGLAEFDLARNRRFVRLDPSSLRESWFRLSLPPVAAARPDGVRPVLENAPSDAPGTLGRPDALGRVYDPFRAALPPVEPPSTTTRAVASPAAAGLPPPLHWQPDSLLLVDAGGGTAGAGRSNAVLSEFGFLGPGLILQQAGFPAAAGVVHHAAATLIPPRLRVSRGANPQPVSVAVSPYLGLDFRPTRATPGEAKEWLLALSELVVFDPARRTVVSLATRFWYPPKGDSYPLIRAWARDTWARLAADSPVGVVRLREVYAAEDAAEVTVVYRFLSAERTPAAAATARRAPALRPAPELLRFAQGQFGGTRMPPGRLAAFELAPPQVSGVQPLRLNDRAGGDWPWGLSALRVSVRQSAGAEGLAGRPFAAGSQTGRVWWQALAHVVQYVVPNDPKGRQILPRMFRAGPIPSLLPAWSGTPLPEPADVAYALSRGAGVSAGTAWQPVLPGGYTTLLTGTRPGVPFTFREHLQTQDLASRRTVQSGAVPVMHRAPRPVLLRPNSKLRMAAALQPWRGAFDPTTNLLAGPDPTDAAFVLAVGRAAELALTLGTAAARAIRGGVIPAGTGGVGGWDGVLRFQAVAREADGDLARPGPAPLDLNEWKLTADLYDGTTAFRFEAPTVEGDQIVFEPADAAVLRNRLAGLAHGTPVAVRVRANNDLGGDVKGYFQTLTFPLRVDRGGRPLYRPAFALFEDPEYNRRLATPTAQKSGLVQLPGAAGGENVTVTVTLAADRREYNATGAIHYLYFCDHFDGLDPATKTRLKTASLQVKRVAGDGTATDLGLPIPLEHKTLPAAEFLDLAGLCGRGGVRLVPGDTLLLQLTISPPTGQPSPAPTVQLAVSIVGRPVTPAPDAGYALLRRDSADTVQVARFAFGPLPARVELLDPADLMQQVTRRRAVFRWIDTVRRNPSDASLVFAVQKTTTFGSTHFPDLSARN